METERQFIERSVDDTTKEWIVSSVVPGHSQGHVRGEDDVSRYQYISWPAKEVGRARILSYTKVPGEPRWDGDPGNMRLRVEIRVGETVTQSEFLVGMITGVSRNVLEATGFNGMFDTLAIRRKTDEQWCFDDRGSPMEKTDNAMDDPLLILVDPTSYAITSQAREAEVAALNERDRQRDLQRIEEGKRQREPEEEQRRAFMLKYVEPVLERLRPYGIEAIEIRGPEVALVFGDKTKFVMKPEIIGRDGILTTAVFCGDLKFDTYGAMILPSRKKG